MASDRTIVRKTGFLVEPALRRHGQAFAHMGHQLGLMGRLARMRRAERQGHYLQAFWYMMRYEFLKAAGPRRI